MIPIRKKIASDPYGSFPPYGDTSASSYNIIDPYYDEAPNDKEQSRRLYRARITAERRRAVSDLRSEGISITPRMERTIVESPSITRPDLSTSTTLTTRSSTDPPPIDDDTLADQLHRDRIERLDVDGTTFKARKRAKKRYLKKQEMTKGKIILLDDDRRYGFWKYIYYLTGNDWLQHYYIDQIQKRCDELTEIWRRNRKHVPGDLETDWIEIVARRDTGNEHYLLKIQKIETVDGQPVGMWENQVYILQRLSGYKLTPTMLSYWWGKCEDNPNRSTYGYIVIKKMYGDIEN